MRRAVSLFSYQEKFYTGRFNLEDCVRAAAATGAEGLEMLADQMIPGYPSLIYNLDVKFVEEWRRLIKDVGIRPIAFDVYGETKLFRDVRTSDEDLTRQLVTLFETGKALGFGLMRIAFLVPPSVIEALIPHAERIGVDMAIEVHAPHRLDGPWVERTLEIAERTGTVRLGIMPDFGTFCRNIPRLVLEDSRRAGVPEDVVSYLSEMYHEAERPADMLERAVAMGGGAATEWLAKRVEINVWMNEDPRKLVPVMSRLMHVHGKFYEMTADLEEPDVRYPELLGILAEHGYGGFISSEYEGQRLLQGVDPGYDEVEQVRRHQAMLVRHADRTAQPARVGENANGAR